MDTKRNLSGLRIVVIGAGPGGLTFAKAACEYGASVEVLEKAGDPRGPDAGYTNRSFNLTLNIVGRTSLGDERAWKGGVNLEGRAIHDPKDGSVLKYANFGSGDAALLTSVPRPALRQNMVSIAEEAGVTIHFRTEASNIEPDEGRVTAETTDQPPRTLTADLIVVADGIHSLADKMIEAFPGGQLRMRTEPLNYVTVLLDKEACDGLSLHHIHFWHQPRSGAVSIGLPNQDGSIAVLLISDYEGVEPGASPFATPDQAQQRLAEDFPRILALDPQLADRLLDRKPGRFYYKSITHYVLGQRCVVVGDAGSATPPWAGFGANTAVYSADALIRFLVGMSDTYQALKSFERHKLALAELILEYADQHGEFLRTKVAETPEDRPIAQALGYLVNEAVEKSDVPDGVKLLRF